jgi:hypothetical protein
MTPQHNHWELVAHTLGIKLYNAQLSKRKKDKHLPNEFYRNYFCSSEGSSDYKHLKELEVLGLTESWEQHSSVYFRITNKGVVEFREYFSENITKQHKPLTKSQENYQKYLDTDTGCSYEEWLGIEPPKREYNVGWEGGVRLVSTKYESVKGDFRKTLKDAKISYKEALKKYKRLQIQ